MVPAADHDILVGTLHERLELAHLGIAVAFSTGSANPKTDHIVYRICSLIWRAVGFRTLSSGLVMAALFRAGRSPRPGG